MIVSCLIVKKAEKLNLAEGVQYLHISPCIKISLAITDLWWVCTWNLQDLVESKLSNFTKNFSKLKTMQSKVLGEFCKSLSSPKYTDHTERKNLECYNFFI